MRIHYFVPALLLAALTGCGGGGSTTGIDSTKENVHSDTSMHHMADTSKMVTPLPEVPAGARVFFKNLKNGQTVTSPVTVEMGLQGLKLDTAGAIVAGSGHHHLLIDAGDSIPAGTIVPKDSTHLHFGNAQSKTEVKLQPGKHVLTLQFADGIHRSYGSRLTSTVTVTVKK